jgi:hypothetical protein
MRQRGRSRTPALAIVGIPYSHTSRTCQWRRATPRPLDLTRLSSGSRPTETNKSGVDAQAQMSAGHFWAPAVLPCLHGPTPAGFMIMTERWAGDT